MDDKKGVVKGGPEKDAQTEVADKLMKDDFICIFRERDLLRNQVDRPLVERAPGVFGSIKRKVANLFHYH